MSPENSIGVLVDTLPQLRLEAVLLGALSEGNAAKEALAQKIEQAIQDVEDLITMYEAS